MVEICLLWDSRSEADLKAQFQKYVVDSYWRDCAAGGEYVRLAEKAFAHPIRDLDGLDVVVATLRDSGVEQIVEQALKEASRILPGTDTTVCIYALDPGSGFVRDYMPGVTGLTPGAGRMML